MQWLFKIWRPYGDSNPGYRRERATFHWRFFKHVFCKVMLTWVGILRHDANFQERDANTFGLSLYLNVQVMLRRGKAVHLALQEN